MTLPNIAESRSPEERKAQPPTPSQAPPYQLRRNRAPRYRCGTCGSRNCSCFNLIERKPPDDQLARGVDALTPTLAEKDTFEDHEQRTIWAIQTENQDGPQVHHILITIEKTYSSIEPGVVPPLETTLKAIQDVTFGLSCLSIQRVDAARQEWIRYYFNRYNSSTPTIDGIRRNWTRRHEHINGTLYHRAEAMATIWRDLPQEMCITHQLDAVY